MKRIISYEQVATLNKAGLYKIRSLWEIKKTDMFIYRNIESPEIVLHAEKFENPVPIEVFEDRIDRGGLTHPPNTRFLCHTLHN